jgi:hypothetical protein
MPLVLYRVRIVGQEFAISSYTSRYLDLYARGSKSLPMPCISILYVAISVEIDYPEDT